LFGEEAADKFGIPSIVIDQKDLDCAPRFWFDYPSSVAHFGGAAS